MWAQLNRSGACEVRARGGVRGEDYSIFLGRLAVTRGREDTDRGFDVLCLILYHYIINITINNNNNYYYIYIYQHTIQHKLIYLDNEQ